MNTPHFLKVRALSLLKPTGELFSSFLNEAFDENLISNEFAVKLCLDYEMKKGKKLVKKELIVALKGELYFVKFIINPVEDDFDHGVILGRSFLRLAKGVVDFSNGVITIYPEPDPFEDDSEKTEKSSDYWDQLLDFNFDDVPKFGEELPPFVCKIGKSNDNKKLEGKVNENALADTRAARFDVLRTAESDSDDKEEYVIKRNKFGALIYGSKPAPYLNFNWKPDYKGSYTKEEEATRQWRRKIRLTDPYNTRLAQLLPRHIYSPCIVNWDVLNRMGCDREIDDMLRIRVCEAESDEEIFTSMAWIRAFNINEPIYAKLCHDLNLLEFARRLGLYQAAELEEDGFNVYFVGGVILPLSEPIFEVIYKISLYSFVSKDDWFISKLARKCMVLTEDVVRSLSALVYCRDLDSITLRDLIDYDGKLIPEDPQPGVPRIGIPRPPRASMQDLYDRMVFEHMAGVYSVPLQGAYNPPGYAQPQYDHYNHIQPVATTPYQQQQMMKEKEEKARDELA
ncbi:hypothetical protein Tco_0877294 [Tanacetum coccineum]|uniref:Uncharacterized protein n=1 Tax=Tanacetum coccineum TaxID=301880 RepID=A0ABQ5BY54_9ASTR